MSRRTFVWTGDLRDDCTAVAKGLMLRAEMMDRARWWWAVYDHEGRPRCNELAASHDKSPYCARTGKIARAECEKAARKILKNPDSSARVE